MSEVSKLEILKTTIQNIEEKKFKILFYVPEHENVASAAIGEIYNFASVLLNAGYDASLLTDKKDYQAPVFMDAELQALPHVSVDGANFKIGPQDYIIIPEYFTNIMEQVKRLPATKIVFAQSYDNVVMGLMAGMTWRDLGITKVIATSEHMANFIKKYHGENTYEIQVYQIGIPDYFFKADNLVRKPIIPFFVRNTQDITKLNKLFYLKNPDLRWVMFEDLRGKTRREFAQALSQATVMVWIDKIASYGTTPIEAMAAGTTVVGLQPEINPPYINATEFNASWSASLYDMAETLGNAIRAMLRGTLATELTDGMQKTASKHTQEASNASILDAFGKIVNNRKSALSKQLEAIEKAKSRITYTEEEENN